MFVILDRIEPEAQNLKTFWFKSERAVGYNAGQFIEMYLPHKNADERGEKHWFTLSSSPSETEISITTKRAVGRVSTFKQHLFALRPGARVRISEPMGDFVLPKDTTVPLLFVAGGIGITPMRSMVKWLLDTHESRQIQLLYGVKTPQELAFMDLFQAYGLRPAVLVSDSQAVWQGAKGHISGTQILALAQKMAEPLIYISGPEPMTETLEADLLATGFPSERLVLDFFPGYQPV